MHRLAPPTTRRCSSTPTTTARDVSGIEVRGELRQMRRGEAEVRIGNVQVTRGVVCFTVFETRHEHGGRISPQC